MFSFADDFTRFTWIFLLKTKADTFQVFKIFKAQVEKQLDKPIKCLQSDWGGPYTYNQNGLVERKHRHISELGLTLLAQAKLPIKFWWDSFHTATHIINRLPTSILSMKTPYECLFHLQPNYPFLKTFGCAYFSFLRDYNHHKFDFHTSKCVFLGYSPLHKGYKCLHPLGKVYIASHVLFDEISFPFSTDSNFLKSMPPKVSDFQYNSLQFYNISVPNNNLKPFEAAAADTDSYTSSSNHNIMLPPFSTHHVSSTNTISSPIIHTTSPVTTSNTNPHPSSIKILQNLL